MPITNYATEALLAFHDGYPAARWNYPDMVGEPLGAAAGVGEGVTLTYSFLPSVPSYYGSMPGFMAFTPGQVAATRSVLASIAEMVDVRFVEQAGVGQLTFANSSQSSGQGGYAYYPSFGSSTIGGEIHSVYESPSGGDVWLNRSNASATGNWQPGAEGYHTLLHEIGHALGLKHSFEGNYVFPDWLDNDRYTVMSYTPAPNTLLFEVTGSPSSWWTQWYNLRASTLMLADIDALQTLYGANTTTRRGNDTYRWETNEELLETIWDAGGRDTIDASNQVYTCIIDLTAPGFSSIGLRQTYEEVRDGLGLPSWFTGTFPEGIYNGGNNLTIARGVVIENARGGSAADEITGNNAANALAGNAGNDTLSGGKGHDTLNGGSGADSMIGGTGDDRFYVDHKGDVVRESKSGGDDLVLSYLTGHTLGSYVEDGRIMASGSANLTGNSLDNTLYAGKGNNVLAGGSGVDTVSYAYATKGVTASLATTAAQATGGSGTDRFSAIENLAGSGFADKLTGSTGNNVLQGGDGNDSLSGGAGNDKLSGGSGNDRLLGGAGRDSLSGGSGKDLFDFNSVTDTSTSSSKWDIIFDFTRGQDDIDLSTIDAKASTAANDAFKFIGTKAFTAAGQLRYVWSEAKDYGVLYGNTDSDSSAEFAIQVNGVSSLSSGDFIA